MAFDYKQIQTLAGLLARTMDWSLSLSGESANVSTDKAECEATWKVLHELE
ncbi:hypothetical protein P8S54_02565 [Thiomicrospira sp. R3]|uniref:hypothetical protein n=1 Tax=Thiomicrospira sp. R3 TaxID=3035472 RepID=UPI00259AF2FE|nr:hypothetical protein [Thiomicrospira sp. R3]WFE69202.1 hypothetical protein P8S54_02565 [Thiomicrospira sp. R3]